MCLCIVGYLFSGEPKVHGVQSAADQIPTLSYYYRQLTKTKIHLTAVLGESGGFFFNHENSLLSYSQGMYSVYALFALWS